MKVVVPSIRPISIDLHVKCSFYKKWNKKKSAIFFLVKCSHGIWGANTTSYQIFKSRSNKKIKCPQCGPYTTSNKIPVEVTAKRRSCKQNNIQLSIMCFYHADDNLLVCNRTHTTSYGDSAFCNVVPDLWNKLPKSLCTSSSVETCKSNLKTHLFPKWYWFCTL